MKMFEERTVTYTLHHERRREWHPDWRGQTNPQCAASVASCLSRTSARKCIFVLSSIGAPRFLPLVARFHNDLYIYIYILYVVTMAVDWAAVAPVAPTPICHLIQAIPRLYVMSFFTRGPDIQAKGIIVREVVCVASK